LLITLAAMRSSSFCPWLVMRRPLWHRKRSEEAAMSVVRRGTERNVQRERGNEYDDASSSSGGGSGSECHAVKQRYIPLRVLLDDLHGLELLQDTADDTTGGERVAARAGTTSVVGTEGTAESTNAKTASEVNSAGDGGCGAR